MIETPESFALASGQLGVLARDFQARLVNYSPSGCLFETNMRIEVGTIGTIRFLIAGRELVDDVQIVRCQTIEGAGSLYQVGARFLWTMMPGKGALRLGLEATSDAREFGIEESRII